MDCIILFCKHGLTTISISTQTTRYESAYYFLYNFKTFTFPQEISMIYCYLVNYVPPLCSTPVMDIAMDINDQYRRTIPLSSCISCFVKEYLKCSIFIMKCYTVSDKKFSFIEMHPKFNEN